MTDYVIEVKDGPALQMLLQHPADFPNLHDNLDVTQCRCSKKQAASTERPRLPAAGADGGVCYACGGMTVRTGSCTECVNCFASSGGCG